MMQLSAAGHEFQEFQVDSDHDVEAIRLQHIQDTAELQAGFDARCNAYEAKNLAYEAKNLVYLSYVQQLATGKKEGAVKVAAEKKAAAVKVAIVEKAANARAAQQSTALKEMTDRCVVTEQHATRMEGKLTAMTAQHAAQLAEAMQENVCVVCLERAQTHVLVPCGHHVVCSVCSAHVSRCPVCCQTFTQAIKVFR